MPKWTVGPVRKTAERAGGTIEVNRGVPEYSFHYKGQKEGHEARDHIDPARSSEPIIKDGPLLTLPGSGPPVA